MSELKPLPTFYSVYLLRSSVKPSRTYIGSTPDPRRRLRQHNGDVLGGARRTHAGSLRPWVMQLLVHGFPSRLAALQFEWAWQNPHITRKIEAEERTVKGVVRTKKKGGRTVKRIGRPSMVLGNLLQCLRGLVECPAYRRWGLTVTVFEEEAWDVWEEVWGEVVHGRVVRSVLSLRESSREEEEEEKEVLGKGTQSPKKKKGVGPKGDGLGGLPGLDISADHILPSASKARTLLSKPTPRKCTICKSALPLPHNRTLVCPHESCRSTAHITCLATAFLQEDRDQGKQHVLPISGHCPKCKKETKWKDLIYELSVRTSTPVKAKRGRKKSEIIAADSEGEESEEEEEEEDGGNEMAEEEDVDVIGGLEGADDFESWIYRPTDEDYEAPLADDWDQEMGSEAGSERGESVEPEEPSYPDSRKAGKTLPILLEED